MKKCDTFRSKDKLGQVHEYRFAENSQPSKGIALEDQEDGEIMYVEPEWFNQRTITVPEGTVMRTFGDMVYKVKFMEIYGGEWKEVVENITETRLHIMNQYPQYYKDIWTLSREGFVETTYIPQWLKMGKRNPWIAEADDPAFTEKSFHECKTIDELIKAFEFGNWSLGSAFYYKDLCFINQVNGGDEWLVIRADVKFESASCGRMIEDDGLESFKKWLYDILSATDEELKSLDYTERDRNEILKKKYVFHDLQTGGTSSHDTIEGLFSMLAEGFCECDTEHASYLDEDDGEMKCLNCWRLSNMDYVRAREMVAYIESNEYEIEQKEGA